MYCVKCGVKLTDHIASCPLCATPVWNPEAQEAERSFPDVYPAPKRGARLLIASILTALCVIAAGVMLLVCLRLYGQVRWGGIASLGVALLYCIAILPLWFRHPNPVIFVLLSHAAIVGFLVYVNAVTGGDWCLSFAFPVTAIGGLLSTAVVTLLRYVRGGRLFIIGGGFLALGGYTMLIELFLHITFEVPMFIWSLYSMGGCALAGLFLLLAAIVTPLRNKLERLFFY